MAQANCPVPRAMHRHRRSRRCDIIYPDSRYSLSFEFLRVYSPSAQTRGHGKPILQTGKCHVMLLDIIPTGRYGIKLVFDDGHDSGIYHWDYLHHLCCDNEPLWEDYLNRLIRAGASRDPDVSVIKLL